MGSWVLVPAVLGITLSTWGCAGACNTGSGYYLNDVALPGFQDCTLTLVGPSNQATYDCPAPAAYGESGAGCTPQGSTPPITGEFSRAGQSLASSGPYFNLSIDNRSSWMSNYLGGSSFELILACGGMTVTQVQAQFSKMQYCEG